MRLFNVQYERLLLHELIFNDDRKKIIKYVYPSLFFEGDEVAKTYHREIFGSIKALNGNLDLLTLHDRINQSGNEPFIKAFVEFAADTTLIKSFGNYEPFSLIKLLKELLFRRLLYERGSTISKMATDESVDVLRKNVFREANKIITLDRKMMKSEHRTSVQLARMVAEKINTDKDIVKTGMPFVNNRFGGLTRGSISSAIAKPKHLKSTFGDSLIADTVEHTDNRGLIISLEDPVEERVKRIIAKRLHVSLRAMRFKEVIVDENDIARVLEITMGNRLSIYDTRDILTPDDAFACINDHKPDIVLVDHIQKFQLDDMVVGLIKAIKTMEIAAVRTNSNICLTSQVSDKKIYGRKDQAPEASDVQWTSALRQSSAEMMGLYYRYQDTKDPFIQDILEVTVLASRYSDAIGKVIMKIDPDKALIGDIIPT